MELILGKLWWALVAILVGSAVGWLVLFLTRSAGAGSPEPEVAEQKMENNVAPDVPGVERIRPEPRPEPRSEPLPPRPIPMAPPMAASPPPPAGPTVAQAGAALAPPTPPAGMPVWAVREELPKPIPTRQNPALQAGPPAMPRPQVPPPLPMEGLEPPMPTRQPAPGKLKAPPTNPAPALTSKEQADQATLYAPPAGGWPSTAAPPAATGTPWPAAPARPPAAPAPPTPTPSFAGPPDNFHEAETVQRLNEPPRPPAGPRPGGPRPVPRTANMLPSPRAPGSSPGVPAQVARSGANIVIHTPVQPQQQGILLVPHRLEVIYGNFSPNDPKEIPFYYCERLPEPCRMLLSSAPGDSIWHVQLNHFSIFPELHADVVCNREGTCVLTNRVKRGQEERFQTRVNGAVLTEGENRTLAPGDIISLGIYRLRFT